jgi:protein phosphatase
MNEGGARFEIAITKEINMGVPDLPGRKEFGVEKRKQFAGTAKLNDPQSGLFLVAEGVGTEYGSAVAAREMAKAANAELGEKLDRMIDNNASRADSQKDRISRIDALTRAKLIEAFAPALDTIRLRGILSNEVARSGLKAVVSKLVELPDATKRLYIAHVGDARAYVLRNGKLYQLTRDQSLMREEKDRRKISDEDFARVDQTIDPQRLSPEQRALFATRTESRFMGEDDRNGTAPEVQAYAVEPGDRVLIANAGVHLNLLKGELEHLMRFESNDRAAESLIQDSADDEVGRKSPRARSVVADLSAVVCTISRESGSREYLHKKVEIRSVRNSGEAVKRQPQIRLLDDEIVRLRAMNARAVAQSRAQEASKDT